MDKQKSRRTDLVHPKSPTVVSLQRLKKREVDRRCQREARERKRSYVAHLEGLVEDLRQQDTSGQVAALLKQLRKAEQERDMVTKTLRDIQDVILQRPLKLSENQDGRNPSTASAQVGPGGGNMSDPDTNTQAAERTPDLSSIDFALPDTAIFPTNSTQLAAFSDTVEAELGLNNGRFDPDVGQQSSPCLSDQPFVHSASAGRRHKMAASGNYDWVNPRTSCCCQSYVYRQPGQAAVWQGNFWKFCSEVLGECLDWKDALQPANDVDSEDIPIRALLHGWDSVEERGALHPSWKMMRRIDEALFGPIPKTERLAMLRAMHLLVQYHVESTPERYGRLPPWYTYRPSQHITHDYGIDYYAWPHFRQRFILDPHAYCGNNFWYAYQSEMRILWPYEFRDCYSHDLETGLYKTSRLFDDRINDINCWTMGSDFFHRFPELSSAIPGTDRRIPRCLSSDGDQSSSDRERGDSQSVLLYNPLDSTEEAAEEERLPLGLDDVVDLCPTGFNQPCTIGFHQSTTGLSQSFPTHLHNAQYLASHNGHDCWDVKFDPFFVGPTEIDMSAFTFASSADVSRIISLD
ncbi:hypothetical protein BKA63DRAFT_39372 [Paraphoma chrysanthemicola]|nr:hypothetical protein BKA63DRAFT_39372 [Paraphoma chrysanthemicola]